MPLPSSAAMPRPGSHYHTKRPLTPGHTIRSHHYTHPRHTRIKNGISRHRQQYDTSHQRHSTPSLNSRTQRRGISQDGGKRSRSPTHYGVTAPSPRQDTPQNHYRAPRTKSRDYCQYPRPHYGSPPPRQEPHQAEVIPPQEQVTPPRVTPPPGACVAASPSRIKSCAIKKCLTFPCYPPFITEGQAGRQASRKVGRQEGKKAGRQ